MNRSVIAQRLAIATAVGGFVLGALAPGASASPLFSKLAAETTEARWVPATALLPDGKVLIAGGYHNGYLKSAELFNPTTEKFEKLSAEMVEPRYGGATATLADGKVLIAGGEDSGGYLKSAELFNPTTEKFEKLSAETTEERYTPIGATLPDGKVLIVGGYNSGYLKSAELFNPATEKFEKLSAEAIEGREEAASATLPDGKVLIVGGYNNSYLASMELFNPATEKFEASSGALAEAREDPSVATLPDGNALIAGGYGNNGYLSSAELVTDNGERSVTLPGAMNQARYGAATATLPDGRVLIASGYGNNGYLKSAEEASIPGAGARIAGHDFGDQTVGEPSAAQSIIVSSAGVQPLEISGASLSGSGAGDFKIEQDLCAGVQLELEQICIITLSFTPQAAGPSSANLTLADNEATPSSLTLSGTGVPANSGPAGPAGVAGPAGKEGAAGKVEVITCKTITRTVKQHGHKRSRTAHETTCAGKLAAAAPQVTAAASSARATLAARGLVYATGTSTSLGHGRSRLVLSERRPLASGRYTLLLRRRHGGRWRTTRQPITIKGVSR